MLLDPWNLIHGTVAVAAYDLECLYSSQVQGRDNDIQSYRMLLRFRNERIQKMQAGGAEEVDKQILSLQEENRLMEERVERNPKMTRLAVDKMFLEEQLRNLESQTQLDDRAVLKEEVNGLRKQVASPWGGRKFRVQSTGYRVQGTGYRVQGTGYRVPGTGYRVQGTGYRVQGTGYRVQGTGYRVQGTGYRVQGTGYRVQGPGYREQGTGPK